MPHAFTVAKAKKLKAAKAKKLKAAKAKKLKAVTEVVAAPARVSTRKAVSITEVGAAPARVSTRKAVSITEVVAAPARVSKRKAAEEPKLEAVGNKFDYVHMRGPCYKLNCARMNVGITHLQQGEFEKAISRFKQVLAIDKYHSHAHQWLGDTYKAMAEVHHKKAYEIDPHHIKTDRFCDDFNLECFETHGPGMFV